MIESKKEKDRNDRIKKMKEWKMINSNQLKNGNW